MNTVTADVKTPHIGRKQLRGMIMNNNYCKRCRLRDGCIRKCKDAEIYEQGYNDAVEEFKNAKKSVKVYEA